MNYAFTDRVRSVLARAREEAISLNHAYVGTEHLLLGLAAEREGVAWAVLRKARISEEDLRSAVGRAVRPGKGLSVGAGELPYTSRGKKTLELAMAEARDLSHSYVGTEHLLLGLVREENGIAAQILRSRRLDLDTTRVLVRRALKAGFSDASGDEPLRRTRRVRRPGRDGFAVRIDDASSASIYEQIVAQVQEAVATGRLAAGDRLPPVRRLADELDIAPGTVARAYGELERLGVVVTEGARGTRVADRRPSAPAAPERVETLIGLLRPVVVAAFHLGATAQEVRASLEPAMAGIFPPTGGSA